MANNNWVCWSKMVIWLDVSFLARKIIIEALYIQVGKLDRKFTHSVAVYQKKLGPSFQTSRQMKTNIFPNFNPLSPNGDQHQFSPNNTYTASREKVMRINKMITKKKCLDLLSNSLNTFSKKMYRNQFGEFVCGYSGLKG